MAHGCNAYDAEEPASAPLSFWSHQDVLRFLKNRRIPISDAYGEIVEQDGLLRTTGEQRTGCVVCGFGVESGHPPRQDVFVGVRDPDGVERVLPFCAELGKASVVQKKWQAEVRAKAEAAASQVEKIAKKGGLDAATVAEIRREILGVAS